MNILYKIKETIKKYSLFSQNFHLLIGLSGGPDSVCLSLVLHKLIKDYSLKLSAVYIDHGLRPDDREREIAFCGSLSESLGIDFFVRTLKSEFSKSEKKHNLHDRLRKLRYAEYHKLAFELRVDRIAIGHTMDDQAETIIMNFLRGSGKKGLSGIAPVNGNIIRPLIDIKREEIESFLEQERIDFITDPTNKKDIYLRNKIRHNLIPQLKQINPSLVHALSHSAEIYRDEDDYLELIVAQKLEQILHHRESHTIELLLSSLQKVSTAIQRRIIQRALESIDGLRGISFTHIENIIKLCYKGKPGDSLNLPNNVRAVKSYSILKITAELPKKLSEYTLNVPGSVYVKEARCTVKAEIVERDRAASDSKESALFSSELLANPLVIRARKPGDFFYPLGFGKKKKLQDFFVDEKVPRDDRDSTLLVTSGDDIIWIVGYRMDERYKVDSHTQHCVQLRVEPFQVKPFGNNNLSFLNFHF
jgi:tRNA(Ile)-lysidine synthase